MNGWGILYIILAYLIGSIPTGVWYSKTRYKVDVRTLGSGNSGGTNVGRNFGFASAVIVIAIDVLKGWIPMAVARHSFADQPWIIMLTALACVIGHAYPIWGNFRGGKIVATSIGVLLGFNFWLAISQVLLFTLCLFLSSTVSLSAMASYGIAVVAIFFLYESWIYRIGFLAIFLFMVYRHRSNVERLIHKRENRISWGLRSTKKYPQEKSS